MLKSHIAGGRYPRIQAMASRGTAEARAPEKGQLEPQHVAAEPAGGRERTVADALEPGNQGRQPRADQAGLLDLRRQSGVVDPPAMRAPGGVGSMLGDHQWYLGKFHLLERAGRTIRRPHPSAAVGAAVRAVVDGPVDRVRGEGRSLVTGVTRLTAQATPVAVLCRRFGRLRDVAGGRLGGIGRVLRQAGHLIRQFLNPGRESGHGLFQLGDACLLPPDNLLVGLFGR